jgi:hypothetical protein
MPHRSPTSSSTVSERKRNESDRRPYAKGRDWYDLVWYLSQVPPVTPNVPLLQAALNQTRGADEVDARAWRALVRKRLGSLDVKAIRDDVSPFLERREDAGLLARENLLGLVRE